MTRLSHGSASVELLVIGTEGRLDAFQAETPSDGIAVIAKALATLREKGCATALAPIGRDTWAPYRLVIETDETPKFPGEPANPAFYVECFQANGFTPVETYISTIDTAPRLPSRPPMADLAITEWDRANPPGDIAAIHALSNAAFADAPFFAPVDLDRFTVLHAPLLASIPTRYALVGRDADGDVVSCLLGYPAPPGLVLKTLMSKKPGAGSSLVDEFYRRAIADRHGAIVHALMREDTRSSRMSDKRNGRVFRRYAVLGRPL